MIAYLDIPSGLSGDMFLGCLVDGGWPIEALRETLGRLRLPAESWSVEARQVMKGPLRATLVDVQVAEPAAPPVAPGGAGASTKKPRRGGEPAARGPKRPADQPHVQPGHSHEHEHAHGQAPGTPGNTDATGHRHDSQHEHPHPHGPPPARDHKHDHDAPHAPKPEHSHGPHRHLADVRAIIAAADLPAAVKEQATAVFVRLAEAEAKVHGTTPEQIHFHEVGALDAIVDIVGVAAGLHGLGIERLYASAVPLGDGWVHTQHGRLPLPAPATLELLTAAHAPTRAAPGSGIELVTPTGAALLAQCATFEQPALTLQRMGIGAGQRDLPWPNVARLWLGEVTGGGPFVQLDTNIDDMNPQLYAPVMGRLFAAGALDVWLTPVQMKKGRPAVVLSVLATAAQELALADLMLRETTTLGVRVQRMQRHVARREMREVATPYGPVHLKLKWLGDDLIGATPEYDDCAALAEAQNVPARLVYEAALAAAAALR